MAPGRGSGALLRACTAASRPAWATRGGIPEDGLGAALAAGQAHPDGDQPGQARWATTARSPRSTTTSGAGLFSAPLRAQLDGHDPAARIVDLMQACDGEDSLLQAQYVDVNTYLVGDILTKVGPDKHGALA